MATKKSPSTAKRREESSSRFESSSEKIEDQETPVTASAEPVQEPSQAPTPPPTAKPKEEPAVPKAEVKSVSPVAVAKPVDPRDTLIEVRPRVDVARASIGGAWYSFRKNVPTRVPHNVRDVLLERGII